MQKCNFNSVPRNNNFFEKQHWGTPSVFARNYKFFMCLKRLIS